MDVQQNKKALTEKRASNQNEDIARKDARIKELQQEVKMLNEVVAHRDDTIKQLKADIKARRDIETGAKSE